jgi:hypothetical protein
LPVGKSDAACGAMCALARCGFTLTSAESRNITLAIAKI